MGLNAKVSIHQYPGIMVIFFFPAEKERSESYGHTNEIMKATNRLFQEHYNWQHRSEDLGVSCRKSGIIRYFLYSDSLRGRRQREKRENGSGGG